MVNHALPVATDAIDERVERGERRHCGEGGKDLETSAFIEIIELFVGRSPYAQRVDHGVAPSIGELDERRLVAEALGVDDHVDEPE